MPSHVNKIAAAPAKVGGMVSKDGEGRKHRAELAGGGRLPIPDHTA